MRAATIILVTVTALGCGGSGTTAPSSSSVPAANLALDSTKGTRACAASGPFTFCQNSYDAHNLGPGCAASVSAIVREQAATVPATSNWSLPADTILRPGQAFIVTGISLPIMESIGSSLTSVTFAFTSVACPSS